MKLGTVLGATLICATTPMMTHLLGVNPFAPAIAQTAPAAQAKVSLELSAAKKVVSKNEKGETVVSWKPIVGNASVNPGDVLRYTVVGKNTGDRPANNLAIVQPIPAQTVYNLNSASFGQGTGTISFSLDKGKTYVAKPTVKVRLSNGTVESRPAPAQYYTHIRWKFDQPVGAKQMVKSVYEVTVR